MWHVLNVPNIFTAIHIKEIATLNGLYSNNLSIKIAWLHGAKIYIFIGNFKNEHMLFKKIQTQKKKSNTKQTQKCYQTDAKWQAYVEWPTYFSICDKQSLKSGCGQGARRQSQSGAGPSVFQKVGKASSTYSELATNTTA